MIVQPLTSHIKLVKISLGFSLFFVQPLYMCYTCNTLCTCKCVFFNCFFKKISTYSKKFWVLRWRWKQHPTLKSTPLEGDVSAPASWTWDSHTERDSGAELRSTFCMRATVVCVWHLDLLIQWPLISFWVFLILSVGLLLSLFFKFFFYV